MKQGRLLNPGFKARNGHMFSERDCFLYNKVQENINVYIKLSRIVPEYLLNYKNYIFKTIINNYFK
jgi:hypothetical protein